MKLAAYVLAGDLTWLERSLAAYYARVSRIVVSYAADNLSWTGTALNASGCVARLRALDVDDKMVFVPGTFHDPSITPMKNETAQRNAALAVLGGEIDWVLQLDTDEVMPDLDALERVLAACPPDVAGVEWPMRVLYRQLSKGRYLEVRSASGARHVEYPGPVAVRPGHALVEARRVDGIIERVVVNGDTSSFQIRQPLDLNERRSFTIEAGQAILHNSWAREPRSVWRKVRGWGHNQGWKTVAYYSLVWLPSPLTFRLARNFHPLHRHLWARLAVSDYRD